MYKIVFVFLAASLFSYTLYKIGLFGTVINLEKGSYSARWKTKSNSVLIWRFGEIIYSDYYDAPINDDSINAVHIKMAEEFLKK